MGKVTAAWKQPMSLLLDESYMSGPIKTTELYYIYIGETVRRLETSTKKSWVATLGQLQGVASKLLQL